MKTLIEQTNHFLEDLKKKLIDPTNKHILGDLQGYFTQENVLMDNGIMSFFIGGYKFIIKSKIYLKEDNSDPKKTNKIVFSTVEIIDDILRENLMKCKYFHVEKIDIVMYYANKKGFNYGNDVDRYHYYMNGLVYESNITDNILGKYCQKLIEYIESTENNYTISSYK